MRITNIVVLASYRTGSTSFCNILSKKYVIYNHDEYFHDHWSRRRFWEKFNIDDLIRKGYVIKIMPDQIRQPYFDQLVKSSVVYGIFRRNFTDQLTSYIISSRGPYWQHQRKGKDRSSYSLKNNYRNSIGHHYDYLKRFNEIFHREFRPLCHMCYAYEDLVESKFFEESDYEISNHPVNYLKVRKLVEKFLKDKK